jgi:hypothetical protein
MEGGDRQIAVSFEGGGCAEHARGKLETGFIKKSGGALNFLVNSAHANFNFAIVHEHE